MGGDGPHRVKVPHYTKWKIEDYPLFVKYQKLLTEEGLKDPWIRNHLWRTTSPNTNNMGVHWFNHFLKGNGFFRGLRWGLATVALYIAADQLVLKRLNIGKDDHGHGH